MGPTGGETSRVPVIAECDGYALCSDVLDLDWIAATPCSGCASADVARGSAHAANAARHDALPALAVTGDELERLLCLARQATENGPTSSR
jgi:hypothetical protein